MDASQLLPAPFSEHDAAIVCTVVAAQIDARFIAIDVTHGSRIDWHDVAQRVSKATQREWSPATCQRVWRCVAYDEDVGPREEVLPDSDGEDEPAGGSVMVLISAHSTSEVTHYHSTPYR